jgi:hypothetical protein
MLPEAAAVGSGLEGVMRWQARLAEIKTKKRTAERATKKFYQI